MNPSDERRSCARLPLGGEIGFRRIKETAQAAPLRDASAAGCRIDTAVSLLEGERTWVRLPGIESIPSTVRWAREWTAGVSFDRPVHPAVFEMVAHRLNRAD